MTARTLKIALAVSVAVNLFALAAGATLLVTRARIEHRIAEQSRPQRQPPMIEVMGDLTPEVRQRVRDSRTDSALAARPDFREARRKRREAVELAAADPLDVDRVRALLEQSQQAELRGRVRLEADSLKLLSELEPADRKIVARILEGRRGRRDRDRREDGGRGPRSGTANAAG